MKVGVRRPSIKRSVSARTTGRVKRKFKRMVNPFYGKKGMGWIKNPKKAMYNKIYRKTTISSKSIISMITALFVGLFMICYYMVAFSFLFLWWFISLLVNGVIALVEFVTNLNAADEESEE